MRGLILMVAAMGFAADEPLVEILGDAQTTHREHWSRGRARVSVEVSRGDAVPARLQGEVAWLESSFVFKCKVTDPEALIFADRGISFSREGNFVAKGKDFVVTYAARNNILHQRSGEGNSYPPIFDLSPFVTHGACCPPSSSQGRPWKAMVGPTADQPEILSASKYEHRKLPGGDVEQTRRNETGHVNVIVFSAADDMAVVSMNQFDPDGTATTRLRYTYRRDKAGKVVPESCVVERGLDDPKKRQTTYRYKYDDVSLGQSAAPSQFTREAVLARIRRETEYGRARSMKPDGPPDDAELDELARGLRKARSTQP